MVDVEPKELSILGGGNENHNLFPWGKLGLKVWIECNHNQKRP